MTDPHPLREQIADAIHEHVFATVDEDVAGTLDAVLALLDQQGWVSREEHERVIGWHRQSYADLEAAWAALKGPGMASAPATELPGYTMDERRANEALAAAHQEVGPERTAAQDSCPTCKGRGTIDTPVTPEGYLVRNESGEVIDTYCRHGLLFSGCHSCEGDSFAAERDAWDRSHAAPYRKVTDDG